MPTYQWTIENVKDGKQAHNLRIDLIKEIEGITGRRLLVYVADFKKQESLLNPEDKTGFSDLIQDIAESDVDLLINSPGGFAEVTESIVNMLRSKFRSVRFAVPNMAKSAATLLVLSADSILMDHRSEIGPVDPQVEYPTRDGRKREAAEDIVDGFEQAKRALAEEGPAATPAYLPLLDKYTIGLLQGCKNAMKLSRELAETWLRKYMFGDDPNSTNPRTIAEELASHKATLSHNRAVGIERCLALKLKVDDLRSPGKAPLADALWRLWCLYELHFERTAAYKIYENSAGCHLQRQVQTVQLVQMPGRPVAPTPRPPGAAP